MRRLGTTAALLLCTCDWKQQDGDFTEQDWEVIAQMVLPALPPPNPQMAQLGQQLFYETELSASISTSHDGQPVPLTGLLGTLADAGPGGGYLDGGLMLLTAGRVSCADCHLPDSWFSDDRSSPNNVSLGLQWTTRNSPSLVNVGHYQGTFAWDGRGATLAQQCGIAHVAGRTMGGTALLVAKVALKRYPDGGWPADAGEPLAEDGGAGPGAVAYQFFAYEAMAAYLLRLSSGDAPIDRFAAGDRTALFEAARRGLKLFIGKAGCVECHRGPAFTDNQYHDVGVAQRGDHVPASDLGRYDGIKFRQGSSLVGCGPSCEALDAGVIGLFRTKGLRQVAKTAPYMHAGQLATLSEVVHFYNVGGDPDGFAGTRSKVLVPLGLTEGEEADLVAFLEALTGEPVDEALRCDSSPAGGIRRYPRCKP